MELEAVLKKILEKFDNDYRKNSRIRALEKTISEGADHYKYAEEMAREVGAILNGALRVYLPEALTDGMLYRKAAEVVLKQPMLKAVKPVSDAASSVQKNINDQAGIGINPITPKVNEDQINGIITGICNAESYESGKETLFDQVENFLEGHVDDCVRENGRFHYEAGLSPRIVRQTVGKCCEWCSKLAGTYDYEDVRDKGNDVFRRHKNCHCIVSYDPGNGDRRRQNVHTKRWTNELRDDMIAFAGSDQDERDIYGAARADLDKTRWEKVNPNRMQRIQAGFSAFPEGDILNVYAKKVKPYKNYFDVAMHGSPDAVGFGTNEPNMKARDLAKIIRRDVHYTEGRPVRLLSCYTGEKVNGEYCFAEELANALGANVIAPEDELYFYPSGELRIGPFGKHDFAEYEPNERRRLR